MDTEQKILISAAFLAFGVFFFALIRAAFLLDKGLGWLAIAVLSYMLACSLGHCVKENRDKREREASAKVEETK